MVEPLDTALEGVCSEITSTALPANLPGPFSLDSSHAALAAALVAQLYSPGIQEHKDYYEITCG